MVFVNVTLVFPDIDIKGWIDCVFLIDMLVNSMLVFVFVMGDNDGEICSNLRLCVGLKHFFLGYPFFFLRHDGDRTEGCIVARKEDENEANKVHDGGESVPLL